eukprot:CAMPEP_0184680532 /NCGR_PEP_ID=MMETSP0312-20130426/3408_1 /TAXON_ID=31354 /ORGANISM="Compsopogon coeruleus, Strain SAG 36.94" /LENGTH=1313 /DNA_ID=CAMNT_0027130689 /DNA_START=79 /DNA_END=4020 /DNA_ORIENTATION=-
MAAKVGKYLLFETLGHGTFGKVKLGVHEETGEHVAVKIMDKTHITQKSLTMQVRREIAIMKALKHKNIVNLHQVLTSKNKIYIVMDLVTGGELFDIIANKGEGGLGESTARKYFQDMVDGVLYCHKRGVYHRDLKPENLLLSSEGVLKITDFGLSAIKGSDGSTELLTTQCGTPSYVAPEMIELAHKGYSGEKVDAWSSGVILFALSAGYLPFDGNDMQELFINIQKTEVDYPPWISPGCLDLMKKLLAKNPSDRWTLRQAREHPWFQVDYEGDDKKPKQRRHRKSSSRQNVEMRKIEEALAAAETKVSAVNNSRAMAMTSKKSFAEQSKKWDSIRKSMALEKVEIAIANVGTVNISDSSPRAVAPCIIHSDMANLPNLLPTDTTGTTDRSINSVLNEHASSDNTEGMKLEGRTRGKTVRTSMLLSTALRTASANKGFSFQWQSNAAAESSSMKKQVDNTATNYGEDIQKNVRSSSEEDDGLEGLDALNEEDIENIQAIRQLQTVIIMSRAPSMGIPVQGNTDFERVLNIWNALETLDVKEPQVLQEEKRETLNALNVVKSRLSTFKTVSEEEHRSINTLLDVWEKRLSGGNPSAGDDEAKFMEAFITFERLLKQWDANIQGEKAAKELDTLDSIPVDIPDSVVVADEEPVVLNDAQASMRVPHSLGVRMKMGKPPSGEVPAREGSGSTAAQNGSNVEHQPSTHLSNSAPSRNPVESRRTLPHSEDTMELLQDIPLAPKLPLYKSVAEAGVTETRDEEFPSLDIQSHGASQNAPSHMLYSEETMALLEERPRAPELAHLSRYGVTGTLSSLSDSRSTGTKSNDSERQENLVRAAIGRPRLQNSIQGGDRPNLDQTQDSMDFQRLGIPFSMESIRLLEDRPFAPTMPDQSVGDMSSLSILNDSIRGQGLSGVPFSNESLLLLRARSSVPTLPEDLEFFRSLSMGTSDSSQVLSEDDRPPMQSFGDPHPDPPKLPEREESNPSLVRFPVSDLHVRPYPDRNFSQDDFHRPNKRDWGVSKRSNYGPLVTRDSMYDEGDLSAFEKQEFAKSFDVDIEQVPDYEQSDEDGALNKAWSNALSPQGSRGEEAPAQGTHTGTMVSEERFPLGGLRPISEGPDSPELRSSHHPPNVMPLTLLGQQRLAVTESTVLDEARFNTNPIPITPILQAPSQSTSRNSQVSESSSAEVTPLGPRTMSGGKGTGILGRILGRKGFTSGFEPERCLKELGNLLIQLHCQVIRKRDDLKLKAVSNAAKGAKVQVSIEISSDGPNRSLVVFKKSKAEFGKHADSSAYVEFYSSVVDAFSRLAPNAVLSDQTR